MSKLKKLMEKLAEEQIKIQIEQITQMRAEAKEKPTRPDYIL